MNQCHKDEDDDGVDLMMMQSVDDEDHAIVNKNYQLFLLLF